MGRRVCGRTTSTDRGCTLFSRQSHYTHSESKQRLPMKDFLPVFMAFQVFDCICDGVSERNVCLLQRLQVTRRRREMCDCRLLQHTHTPSPSLSASPLSAAVARRACDSKANNVPLPSVSSRVLPLIAPCALRPNS